VNSGEIALAEKPCPRPDLNTSTEPKKKSLFLMIGRRGGINLVPPEDRHLRLEDRVSSRKLIVGVIPTAGSMIFVGSGFGDYVNTG